MRFRNSSTQFNRLQYHTCATLCSDAEPEEAAPEDFSHESPGAFRTFVRAGPSRAGARDAFDDSEEGLEEEPPGKEPFAVYEQV